MQRLKEIITNIFMIPELRRRLLITFVLLGVFRLGFFIPIPGINIEVLREWINQLSQSAGRIFAFATLFSGGALSNMSVFSLGIMPYITSSIMFSLLIKVIPKLEALAKEGPSGYRKISQYTRWLALPISMFWAIFIVIYLQKQTMNGQLLVLNPGMWAFTIPTVITLSAGAMFVMWLGEQITEFGLGNGASIIIMAGIVARMPYAVFEMYRETKSGDLTVDKPIIITLLYMAVVVGIVYMTQAQRRIPIQYSKHIRGRMVYGGQRHFLPLRLNQAGVMPVIFASTMMVLPDMIGRYSGSQILSHAFSRGESGFWFSSVYTVLIFAFTYFWTALYFKPDEMSENLKESGSFVPGIRPGQETAIYLETIMNRIVLMSATFLTVIVLLPNLVSYGLKVDRFITSFLGGTGILIVVGVGLDLMQKVESHLILREYEGFLKKGRVRGRR
ncbi:MAG: preprotein translocase subunit SecY [Planctomycetota bacterium]